MDAIMVAMVAVLLANADGHTGSMVSRLLAERRDRRIIVGIAVGAFVVNAVIAAVAGTVANRMIGQGVVTLLVAFALLSAAAALLWNGRLMRSDEAIFKISAPLLALRLILKQFGDRSHFLIGALAATSGAGHWAAAGGLAGWVFAMVPFLAYGPVLADRRAAAIIRWVSAAVLGMWGLRSAMTAFGLLGH